MFAKLSGWIALPVIAGAFLGKWLDKKYGTEPWLFLGSVGAAFLISMVGLVVEAKREFRRIDKNFNSKIKNQNGK
jgi:F0F1-type ATP synthase assembly protein I